MSTRIDAFPCCLGARIQGRTCAAGGHSTSPVHAEPCRPSSVIVAVCRKFAVLHVLNIQLVERNRGAHLIMGALGQS